MQVEREGWCLHRPDSGARVSNAYTIYHTQEDSPGKLGLILHGPYNWHQFKGKAPALKDECAYY